MVQKRFRRISVPIIPKFVDIVVNGIAERAYGLKAFSVDPIASKKRTDYVDGKLNDMYASTFANTIQQTLGVNTLNNPKE